MRNHFNGKLTVAVFGLFTFFALTFTSPASAQSDGYNTNSNLRGVVPFGTYQFGEIDNINLASGTVNLRIPLVSRQGRGSAEGLVFVYSSKIWVARPIPDPIYPDQFKWMAWEPTAELSHARVIETGTPGELQWTENWYTCFYDAGYTFNVIVRSNFSLRSVDGAVHQFPNRKVTKDLPAFPLSECYAPMSGEPPPPADERQLWIGYSDSGTMELDITGTNFLVRFKDGGVASYNGTQVGPPFQWYKDRNGNIIDVNGDTLKRTTFKASDGQSLGYGISGSIVSVTTQFPTTGTSQSPNCVYQYQSNLYLTNSLTLPNGQQFTFEYDPVFRELTLVNLPTGGYIKYVYQTFPSMDDGPPVNTSCVIWLDSRRVVERRVSSDGVNEEVWTYSYPPSGATEVTDPLGNVSVHLFLDRIYEYSTELRNGAGVPLRRTVNDWGGDGGPIQLNQDGSHLSGPKNRRITASTTTLLDTNQVSKRETDYDQFTYQSELPPYNNVTESRMNVTETREYDYGVGSPGPLVRKTTFTYNTSANYLSRHIWGLLTSKKVYDGSGNLRAESQTLYDTHPLASSSGAAVQHDYTNYGTGMNYRGNPTESKVWRNTDGAWLTSKSWYDDLGNVIQSQDPLGHNTYFSYADSWTTATGGNSCTPVGGSAHAFVTEVTNHLGHAASTKYFSCSSLAGSTTDPNNHTTTITYDLFNRPVSTTRPDGGSTTWTFDDLNRKATTTQTIGNGVSPVIAEYHYDGLWRVFESRLTSDPQGTVYTVVEFDALGRTKKAWNPTRCSSPKTNNCESTWGITEFVYDELGRTTKVIPPDGTAGSNYVATAYSGNSVTVTDQAGRLRRSYTDALGRLIEVHEPTGGSNPTAGTGSSTVSGSLQTISATPGTGSSTISGSLQTIGGTPATPGTGWATVAGSVQTLAPTAGTGSATIAGSEQSIPATQSTGWVDITGTEQSVTVQEYVGDECVMYGEFGCEEWQPVYEWVTYWDSGGVSVTVNGLTKPAYFGQGSTGNSLAVALANAINGDSGYPVTASVSGIRINLTSKGTGAATNYSLSVTSWTDDPGHFSPPSFVPVRSGAALTGGANTIYDTGSVWVTVNGATKTVNYGEGSTATSVATALRDAVNADGGYPVSANLSGSTVNLTAKSTGAGTNYSLSKGSSTSQPGNFASPSFSVSTSGAALTGGADTIYDSGSVWVTVNGLTKSVNYSQGSTSSSVASALVTTINADAGYPVSAGLSGSTVNLTSKSAGASTNYSLTEGSSTSQPGNFAGPSFSVSTSGSTLTGGSNGTPDIYDTGSVWVTVNGVNKSVSYGQGSTSSSVATALRDAINADGGYPATAALNGTTVNLTARTTGAATNYSLTAGSSTSQPGSFSQPSFAAAVSGANLTGGADTVYDSGNVWVNVGGFQAQVNYGQGSTASGIASAIANILNTNGSSPVTASPSGGSIALTAKVVGSISNYLLSAGSSTTSGSFADSSFPVAVSGPALTGGADPSPGSLTTPAVTLYTYDTLDSLTCVVQKGTDTAAFTSCAAAPAAWRPRSFSYNSLSQLLAATNPESGTITYTYDNDGNLLTKTDARSITTTHAYDALHRLTGKTYSNGDPAISYFYDQASYNGLTISNGVGRRTGMSDAAGGEAWSFDSMGRVLTDRRTTNGVTNVFSYLYNLDGSLWKLTYPSGRVITYSYSSAARLTAAQDVANGINYATGASYTAGGALLSLTNATSIVSTYYYNNRMQPCRVSVKNSGTAPSNCTDANMGNILDFGYGFTNGQGQNNGNVVSIANNREANRSQSFTYDELNRIKTAQSQATSGAHDWGLSFGYDIWANLLSATVTKGNDVPMLSQSVGTNNRLSGYSYDAAGNMLSDGSFSYTWDAESRMKTGAGVTYTYDGDGRRVKKSNGKLYWYGPGLDALLETDLAGNNPDEYIFFGGKRVARRQSSGTVNYYFSDHLGSSRVVASSAGAILDDSDFYPFGGERLVTSSSGNHYKFTGKERDAESNLDYFIARYYSSQQGRFLSPDEFTGGPVDAFSSNDPLPPGPLPYAIITNPQSLNKYSYTWNNPIRYIDRNGHWLETAWDVASFVVGAKSLVSNVRAGNYGAAALDALGVVADGVAVVAPVVPGGVSIALKAGRAANKLDNATDAAGAANKLDSATDAGQATTRYEPGTDFSKKTKQEAREKADGNCEYCGEKTTPGQKSEKGVKRDKKEGTTDHYDPKSKGGTNDPRNAKHSCLGCNQNKGTKTPAQWEKERKPD